MEPLWLTRGLKPESCRISSAELWGTAALSKHWSLEGKGVYRGSAFANPSIQQHYWSLGQC